MEVYLFVHADVASCDVLEMTEGFMAVLMP